MEEKVEDAEDFDATMDVVAFFDATMDVVAFPRSSPCSSSRSSPRSSPRTSSSTARHAACTIPRRHVAASSAENPPPHCATTGAIPASSSSAQSPAEGSHITGATIRAASTPSASPWRVTRCAEIGNDTTARPRVAASPEGKFATHVSGSPGSYAKRSDASADPRRATDANVGSPSPPNPNASTPETACSSSISFSASSFSASLDPL